MLRARNQGVHFAYIAFKCMLYFTGMMRTTDAYKRSWETEGTPQTLISLKQSLDSKLSDGMANRTYELNNTDLVKFKNKSSLIEGKEEVGSADGQPFYTRAAAHVGDESKLSGIKTRGIGMTTLRTSSAKALAKSINLFNAMLRYVEQVETLIAASWNLNDKLFELHDAAITRIQAPIVEGHFPENKDKPIKIFFPLGGQLYFQWDCALLTANSERLLKEYLMRSLANKIKVYAQEDNEKKFVICSKAKTSAPSDNWNDYHPVCQQDLIAERANKHIEKFKELVTRRDQELVKFLKAEKSGLQSQASTQHIFIGKSDQTVSSMEHDVEQMLQHGGGGQYTPTPGGTILLKVYNKDAEGVGDHTECKPDEFVEIEDKRTVPQGADGIAEDIDAMVAVDWPSIGTAQGGGLDKTLINNAPSWATALFG